MSLHLHEAWVETRSSPVFGVALTLVGYQLGRVAWRRAGRNPLLNPVLIAVVTIALVMWACDIDYDTYFRGGAVIALLLGPATVALAVPMHRELEVLRQAAVPVVAGVLAGSGVAVVVAVVVTRGLGGDVELARSMAPKSTTTPVSIALSQTIGGLPALTAVLTILAGIIGAVIGPALLTALHVRDPRVRGLAVGVASHGIGTSQMLHEGRTQGAFAGLAMALTALATSVWAPLLVPWLT
jgi:predicted murein hydrolase (TIGR00659 family)